MPKLVRGDLLPTDARQAVLAGFPFRWTHENAARRGVRCVACADNRGPAVMPDPGNGRGPTPWHEYHVPQVSDAEWLRAHAFCVNKDGRLSARRNYAHPASMIETEGE